MGGYIVGKLGSRTAIAQGSRTTYIGAKVAARLKELKERGKHSIVEIQGMETIKNKGGGC